MLLGISLNTNDRLRSERERLGLNQEQFGALGGVKKLAQINYEKGDRSPDAAYLSAIALAGADVLYILTGQRSRPVPAAGLPKDQQALLNSYELCSAAAKKNLLQTAALLAAGLASGGQGDGINQTISAPVLGSVAGRDVFHNSPPARSPRKPR